MLAASEVAVESVTFGLCSTIVGNPNNSASLLTELGTELGTEFVIKLFTELLTELFTGVFVAASPRAVLSTVLLSTSSISPSKKSKSLISILDTFLPS